MHAALNASALALASINPLDWAGFFAIFSFSFLASLHCALMCAPLVCALLGRGGRVSPSAVLFYNLGRFFSYAGAGAALGAFGGALLGASHFFGFLLAALVAVSLGAAVLAAVGAKPRGLPANRLVASMTGAGRRVTAIAVRFPGRLPARAQAFSLGLVTVFLPCMTLSPVLILAAASTSAAKGAATLVAFHAGTLAVMITAPVIPGRLIHSADPATARRIALVFLLAAGLATVFRLFH